MDKKSAIYIDIDDDITAIIEKVRSNSGNKIALVPPKRIGVLQSAVNLKLLKRAAESKRKEIFLVTADQPLALLAATAGIAVARNLKSDPEIMPLPEESNFVDVINGEEVTAEVAGEKIAEDKEITAAVKAINDDDEIADEDPLDTVDKKAAKTKIPNINNFRKKLLLIISGAVVLIIFLVWLFVFAPSATITIEAKNEPVKVDQAVFLSPSENTDPTKYRIKAIVKQTKKTDTVEFEATGEKTVGERATGKVNIQSGDMGTCMGGSIASGSRVILAGKIFTTTAAAALAPSGSVCVANDVSIIAESVGEEFNIPGGGGNVPAYTDTTASGSTSGGSKRIVRIVSPSDIDKVKARLQEDKDNQSVRDDLIQQFDSGITVINDSFKAVAGSVKTDPAVNTEVGASGRAKASVEVTYSLMGISVDDINKILDAAVMSKVSNKDQKQIFDNGFRELMILSFNQADGDKTASIRMVTTAKVGPKIDEEEVKEQAVGRKSSEISEAIKKIDGVQDVRVELFPFWLSTAPSVDRIKVVFSVE